MSESIRTNQELATLLSPATFTSDTRLYRLEPALDNTPAPQAILQALEPEAWIARESLSEIGELRLLCLSLQADLPVDELMGQGLLLHTRCADGSLFTRSGLVRQAERLDAQGALARYRLTLVPWLWLATQQARSQIFQERPLAEIIELILAPYCEQGGAWRFSADARAHLEQLGKRSYCSQWRETDYAFFARLLAEEGLGWRVETSVGQPEATWGHEIVIFANSTQASAAPNCQASPARFHRQGAQESDDAVQALARRTRFSAASVNVGAWNPDARTLHQGSSRHHWPAQHAQQVQYEHLLGQDDHSKNLSNSRSVESCAQRLIEGIEAHSDTILGHSSLRQAQTGTQLTVTEAPALGMSDSEQAVLLLEAIEHAGFNNLPTDTSEVIAARLGRAEDHLWFAAAPPAPDALTDTLGTLNLSPASFAQAHAEDGFSSDLFDSSSAALAASDSRVAADSALFVAARSNGYANRFRATHAARPWRPALPAAQHSAPGSFLAAKPLAFGVQSALVVGPDGSPQANGADEIYTNARGDVCLRFHWQSESVLQQSTLRTDSTRWVRTAQRQAGPGLGWQWLPRIGQEVLVKFTDGDPDQPLVIGTLYNGRGAGGIAPTPGGAAANSDSDQAALFAQAHDGTPSAQENLAAGLGGGHAPAWHSASPESEGHRNASALWGFKSKELGGSGYSQLVFDDSDQQLRMQLAASTQNSQLNLGHLIHQQDNYRGGVRGQGLELRSDGYTGIRGGAGVLLSTYHGPSGNKLEPTADFAAGMAMFQQLNMFSQNLDKAAATHESVRLPGHAGSHQANASAIDDANAPHAALLRSASSLVDADSSDQALADAEDKDSSIGPARVPHSGDAVIAAAAKGGLLAIAGQHLQLNAGENVTLAAGDAINLALNSQARLHAGQAIGLVAAAAKADHNATGLSIIAAQDTLDIQAQSDVIKLQAKEQLSLQSADSSVELAAARKIRIATAQGAAITIEGGNITFEAPGSITYKTAMRTLEGPKQAGYALPEFPQSVCISCLLKALKAGSSVAAVRS